MALSRFCRVRRAAATALGTFALVVGVPVAAVVEGSPPEAAIMFAAALALLFLGGRPERGAA